MQSKSTIWKQNVIVPPMLFECVTENVYRSNLVTDENLLFLQSISLKTVVVLGDVHLSESVALYFQSYGICVVENKFIL